MGTRALTFIEPHKIWVVTQWDGDPNWLGRTLRKLIKIKPSKEDIIIKINNDHEIRGKGQTELEALKDYFGKGLPLEELKRMKGVFIEFIWKINKDWKVERIKDYALEQLNVGGKDER